MKTEEREWCQAKYYEDISRSLDTGQLSGRKTCWNGNRMGRGRWKSCYRIMAAVQKRYGRRWNGMGKSCSHFILKPGCRPGSACRQYCCPKGESRGCKGKSNMLN